VVKLNALGVKPGEQIQITRVWSGKVHERMSWTICLAHQSEMARAEAGEPDSLTQQLQASIDQSLERKSNTPAPTPIRKPAAPAQREEQPKLFSRGTGTDGPAPQPMPAPAALPQVAHASGKRPVAEPIPWNIAFREVSKWVSKELQSNNLQWSDESQKSMVCTVLIQEAKAGKIGMWERGGE
jgi:hypothetical protein